MEAKAKQKDRGTIKPISSNKRATFNYAIEAKFEAGISLKGSEVKSCRNGQVQLVDSYAMVEKGEIFLYKVHIAEHKEGGPFYNHPPARKRKLLMHKREIKRLAASIEQKGYTLVPLRFYFKGPHVKVELGLAKGKTKGDKRESIKTKDVEREMRRERAR
jgi:SsrA-binding protein